MNQSDGDKVLINAKKKNIQNKNVHDSKSSSGFSFFRWFKKDEGRHSKHSSSKNNKLSNGSLSGSGSLRSELNESSETLGGSPSPSPTIDSNNLSKASSCDSILSTATTGFAFVPPNNYQPCGSTSQAEKLITPGPYTDSYKRRLRQREEARELDKKYELTLRKKYKIFASFRQDQSQDYTLTRENQKTVYADLSLPNAKNRHDENVERAYETNTEITKKHRRTVSDSSKDRRAGSYLHVKGKRKAPPPPPLNLNDNQNTLINTSYGTLSPRSTLGRKKRPAPPPPLSPTSPINNLNDSITSLLEDKEIKAIIEGAPKMPFQKIKEESPAPQLTEEQKDIVIKNIQNPSEPEYNSIKKHELLILEAGYLRSNGAKSPIIEQIYEEAAKQVAPTSPISPRPWYKRPVSGSKQQDTSIPFKRDVILKTMDKRKNKNKEKEDLPEVGFCRNSIFEGSNKFNLFSRITEKSDDTKRRERESEKRRSGIGIPNISELDREAAEIVNKENASKMAKKQIEDEKYYKSPGQLMLRTQMFGTETKLIEPEEEDEEEAPKRRSARELISKFEANSANINRITVNTAFVAKKDYFGDDSKKPAPPEAAKVSETKEPTPPQQGVVKNNSEVNLLGLWKCPYCTLENPNWRIICEACERIKPYDKLSILEGPPLRPFEMKKVAQEAPKTTELNVDWEKKTEKVLQYFMPKEPRSNGLAKSASETSIAGVKKPPTKLLGSPKFGVRNRKSPEKSKLVSNNRVDDEKLTESNKLVIAPLASPEKTPDLTMPKPIVNIEEIRNARIARFSGNLDSSSPIPTIPEEQAKERELTKEEIKITNQEALEKEKERLREMIRAMNAKALAEKYPVLPKQPSPETTTPSKIPQSPKLQNIRTEMSNDPTKLGAIKKYFGRKQNEDDVKIINKDKNSSAVHAGILKKDKKTNADEKVEQLVLKNDTNSMHYELMDLSQFVKQNTLAKAGSPSQSEEKYPVYENNEAVKPHSHVKFSEQDSAQVKEITNQLRSQNGLENFKATLKYTSNTMNKTNTLAINKILRNLEIAICEGQHDLAASLAVDLAKMKVSLSVTRHKNRPYSGIDKTTTSISIDVYVEDKVSHKGPFKINVSTFITIMQLKEKMSNDFNIPIHVQKWIYEDQIATEDDKTLFDYGIYSNDTVMYLYLVAPELVNVPTIPEKHETIVLEKKPNKPLFTSTEANLLSVSDGEDDDDDCSETQNDDALLGATAAALPKIPETNDLDEITIGWECPLCTLINPPDRPGCNACSEERPSTYIVPKEYAEDKFVIPDELKKFLQDDLTPKQEQHNDLNRAKINRKSSDIFNILFDETKAEPKVNQPPIQNNVTNELFKTTNLQLPGQNSIVMTAFTSSPNITRTKYRGVDNFNPNSGNILLPKPKETFITTASPIVRSVLLREKPVKFGKNGLVLPDDGTDITNHYMELVNLENADLIANIEPFECPICFMPFESRQGIILRECLHSFCKECLINTVRYSEEPAVKCPFMDNEYSCECIIQEREIKALVNKEMFENHLTKSIRLAENKIENAFHCKTPNCRGWCIYEEDVNQFKCPVCTIVNCLTCRVIHDGLNCKQYQDRMNSDCDTNLDAKRTKEMLKDMVDNGEAINCPTCQVVMMKKWGCDWLKCTMCKTEICWVTRGPRWGPGGKGDTTGGCKCGFEGKKCHPKCNYCH